MTWEPERVRQALRDYDKVREENRALRDMNAELRMRVDKLVGHDLPQCQVEMGFMRELARDLWAQLCAADQMDDGAWIDARMAERVREMGVE